MFLSKLLSGDRKTICLRQREGTFAEGRSILCCRGRGRSILAAEGGDARSSTVLQREGTFAAVKVEQYAAEGRDVCEGR